MVSDRFGYVELVADEFDIEDSGLLDGLEGRARAERAELIPWLLERGVTVAELQSSVQPMLLASRRFFGEDGTLLSARQISAEYGLDLDLLERVMRASGLPWVDDPDAEVYLRTDGQAAGYVPKFLEVGLTPDQVVLVVQVLAEGLTRATEVMRHTALAAILEPDSTELDIAKSSETLIGAVAPLISPMISDLLQVQLLHQMETEAVTAAERAEGLTLPGAREVTIAFADLVGFTRLGEVVPPEDLEKLAHQLTDLAHQVARPPVRYVKSIGDEVMLVSTDPVAMLEAVLDLVDATEAIGDFPRLRTGLASGMAVGRAGDWFGSPVNLASRVTSAARPGAILVAEPTREIIGGDESFTWSFAGSHRFKGIKDDVKVFRARRSAPRAR
jgi:adenylate cyclase